MPVGRLQFVQTPAPCCDQGCNSPLPVQETAPGNVYILLDAAKAAQSRPPDLSRQPVHFATLSFYKVFGYPTGLGVLLVRSDCLPMLKPQFLGGGTLEATLPASWPSKPVARQGVAAFEPGTVNFHGIAQLRAGFDAWQQDQAAGHAQRACKLATALAEQLADSRHANGASAVQVYARQHLQSASAGCQSGIGIGEAMHDRTQSAQQGAMVAFNMYDSQGQPIGCDIVAGELAAAGIAVRAGRCCNPGACNALLNFSDADLAAQHEAGLACGAGIGVWRGRHAGIVRASFGMQNTESDIHRLVAALRRAFVALSAKDAAPQLSGSDSQMSSCTHSRHALRSHALDALSASASLEQQMECSCSSAHERVPLRIAAMRVYPVKSCGGMAVSSWPLTPAGLLYDRAFQLVDRSGRALTLSRHPQLAQLSASIDLHSGSLTLEHVQAAAMGEARRTVCIQMPAHMMPIDLQPAGACAAADDEGQTHCTLRSTQFCVVDSAHEVVHKDCSTYGRLVSATSWLTEALGVESFLVCHAASSQPETSEASPILAWLQAGQKAAAKLSQGAVDNVCQHCSSAAGDGVSSKLPRQSFANARELLVATSASAAAFAASLQADRACSIKCKRQACCECCAASWSEVIAAATRFRVNILFAAQAPSNGISNKQNDSNSCSDCTELAPYSEDSWQSVELQAAQQEQHGHECSMSDEFGCKTRQGDTQVVLRAAGPAVRCTAINIDWAARGKDQGRSALRILAAGKSSASGSVTWGMYMRPEAD